MHKYTFNILPFCESRMVFFAKKGEGLGGSDDGVECKVEKHEGIQKAEETRSHARVLIEANSKKTPEERKLDEHYAYRENFVLDEEVDNGNISSDVAVFIREHPETEEALKRLCEYDAYSYIHTVQMLNEGCFIVNNHFNKIKQVIEKDSGGESQDKFHLTGDDLKMILFGAVILHDLGKIYVDREILNFKGRLDAFRTKEMEKHPMRMIDIVVSSVISGICPDCEIDENIKRNRVLREENNEFEYLLGRIDDYISQFLGNEDTTQDSKRSDELLKSIGKISEAKPEISSELNEKISSLLQAIESGNSVQVDIFRNEIAELKNKANSDNLDEMKVIQPKIKTPVDDLLKGEKYPNENRKKRLIQMVYAAASHHRYKAEGAYPSVAELSGVLPDYEFWINESTGDEQAIIIAILDVNDAVRSRRSYKDPIKSIPRVKGIIESEVLNKPEYRKKYDDIFELIVSEWHAMRGSAKYTVARKEKDDEKKKADKSK